MKELRKKGKINVRYFVKVEVSLLPYLNIFLKPVAVGSKRRTMGFSTKAQQIKKSMEIGTNDETEEEKDDRD